MKYIILASFLLFGCNVGNYQYSNQIIKTKNNGSVRVQLSNVQNEKMFYECTFLGNDNYLCSINYKVYDM
jgi:hypothetical protein